MRVRCKQHYDKYRYDRWPEELCCRPQIGDYIESLNGVQLKIVQITHAIDKGRVLPNGERTDPQPFLEIELQTQDGKIPPP